MKYLKLYEQFEEDVFKWPDYFPTHYHADKIIKIKQIGGKFKIGDAVEIIGPPRDPLIGLKGIIIPTQLSIEPSPDRGRPKSVKEGDFYIDRYGNKIFEILTRWPDPEGKHYEFWHDSSKKYVDNQFDIIKNYKLVFFPTHVSEENLIKINKKEHEKELIEYVKKMEKKIKDKELRRKEMSTKHKEEDPFGEEIWED